MYSTVLWFLIPKLKPTVNGRITFGIRWHELILHYLFLRAYNRIIYWRTVPLSCALNYCVFVCNSVRANRVWAHLGQTREKERNEREHKEKTKKHRYKHNLRKQLFLHDFHLVWVERREKQKYTNFQRMKWKWNANIYTAIFKYEKQIITDTTLRVCIAHSKHLFA